MGNYWQDELDKLKKSKSTSPTKATTSSNYWQNEVDQLKNQNKKKNKKKKKKETEDIAPVKKTATKTEERKWFQKGGLEDGFSVKNATKTAIASGADLKANVGGGLLEIGEKVADALLYVGGAAAKAAPISSAYKDLYANETQKLIAKDLYDGEKVANFILNGGNNLALKALGEDDYDEASVFGEKTDSLAQSGGQLIGTVALQAVGVPWFVTTGVTSFGGGVEQAFNEGANYTEAGLSGAVQAGADILTEKLFGGSGLGEKGLINLEPLTRGISNKVVKTLVDYGIDVAAEGSEEVVAGIASNLGSALYKEGNLKDIVFSEEAIDEYIESFVGGAVLGGGMNSVNAGKSVINKTDYRTGLNANDQKVFDKVYDDILAEAEQSGKQLTKKDKEKIYNELLEDVEKGYISTDTIEEVLGGESYDAYKTALDEENARKKGLDALKKEYDELYKMKNGEKSDEQIDRQAYLKKRIEEISQVGTSLELKTKLSNEVFNLVKDSKLAESYNEKARRGQAFEADLSQYDTKYHDTIKKAAESGILNNTRRTHEFVDMIAKISADKGVFFDFTNNEKIANTSFAVEGKIVNGYVDGNGNIALNIDSPKALNSTVGHEITHILEGTELYDVLQTTITEYAKSKGEYDSRLETLTKLYEGVEGADVNAELTADLVGDYLFTDTKFIHKLSTEHRNIFEKIYDEIEYLCRVATAGSKEARQLEKVKKTFEDAYRESGNAKESGTNYSISGVNAKTANGSTLIRAKQMLNSGANSETVRQVTGWYKGKDNKWRFYIPDNEMKVVGSIDTNNSVSLGNYIEHHKLFAAYPELKNVRVRFGNLNEKNNGQYSPENNEIVLSNKLKGDVEKLKNTLVHEIQHAIQKIEGFAVGGNRSAGYVYALNMAYDKAKNSPEFGQLKNKEDKHKYIVSVAENLFNASSEKDLSYKAYRNLYGEAEAWQVARNRLYDEDLLRLATPDTSGNVIDLEHETKKFFDIFTKFGYTKEEIKVLVESVQGDKSGSIGDIESGSQGNEDFGMLRRGQLYHIKSSSGIDGADGVHQGASRENRRGIHTSAPELSNTRGLGDRVTTDNTNGIAPIKETSSVDGVFFDGQNTKYSLSADSEGTKLSKGQQEYFKDSKMRDENGGLKVVYHGTRNADFTIFKKNVNFFTDSKEMADSYSPNGEMFEGYLNITKPYELDAKGEKWSKIPIDEATKNFLQEYGAGVFKEGGKWRTTPADIASAIEEAVDNGDMDYDGIIIKNIDDTGSYYKGKDKHLATDYIVFNSNQFKNVDNKTPTNNPDITKSLSEQGETPKKYGNYNVSGKDIRLETQEEIAPTKTVAEESTETEDYSPAVYEAPTTEEAANALASESLESLDDADAPIEVEEEYYNISDTTSLDKKTLQNIGKSLRETLSLTPKETKAIQDIVQEYSTTEFPSNEELFETIQAQFSEKIWKDKNEAVAEVKRWLRKAKINVSPKVKAGIDDYSNFRKSHSGKIGFSKEGIAVDSAYQELNELFPDFFPANIVNEADQLLRMGDVADLEIYTENSYRLDDDTIQEAVNIISNEVRAYKDNLTQTAAEETAREDLDDIAPAKATQIAEGMTSDANLVQSLENHPIKTVKERETEKLRAVESELADNKQLRREAEADYNAEIARLQEEYAALKDKNTQKANNIIRRVVRLERLKATVDADYAKRISDLEARAEKMNSATYQTAVQRKSKMQEYTEQMETLVGDTSTWQDKKMGISYKVNTLRRNLRDIVRDENGNRDIAKADAIYEELQGKYNHNEASLNREANQIKKVYADLKITKAENEYIQMLGELRHNPNTTLTEDAVNEFYEKNKRNIDEKKVDKAIELARQTYDSLLERVNNVLREQGMKEIPYRKGYFPHFTEEKQGFLAKLFNWKTQNNEIPTDIAGLTENFNPERSWQSFNKERKGDTTDYNFEKGLDTYVQGALDWIYHIEDIQKRRAFENHIRYIHSDKGVQEKIEAIRNNEEYDADEAQAQIDLVYKEAGNPLNNFVTDFRTATNTLAGKKSSLDRTTEEYTNRKIYSVMTNIQNRMSANMIAGSVSSALTNFIPITQSWAQVSPVSSLRAMGETIKSTIRDDGTIDKSDFLTNRLKKSENLYQTTWDKVIDKAGILMESVDSFTSQVVWRSKYNENISKGMSENEAIKNADQFAENVLAGRSRGNQPTLFDAKNPLAKTFTLFQLEVNNQYGYMFKDVPQDVKAETKHWKANLTKGYVTMFLGAYAYNALYSSLVGRDAAFDPIGIVEDLLRDLGLFGDDEEEEPADTILNLADNILEEVPFVGGMLGGGRIPISSALPYDGVYEMFSGTVEDIGNKDWTNLTNEWLNPLTYLALPAGGGQIKKTMQGLSIFNTNEDHPIAGSYTNSGDLRFPVDDTLGNRIQAGIFGQWANENARDYIENGRKPLNEKQIQEFIDVDIPIKDYWEYREGLKGLDKLKEKIDYIDSLDLPLSKKNILVNNIVDRKEDIDLENYSDFSSLEEFDFATKYPEKYSFFQENGISYADYESADEDGKRAYTWAFENPEKYTLSKAVADDVIEYRSYTSDLYDIRADKDENGDTIIGSGKEKKLDYINNLDNLEYGQKIILFKSLYNADDTYNYDIIDYLNEREDISYDEMVTILKELDFEVDEDGNIYWD